MNWEEADKFISKHGTHNINNLGWGYDNLTDMTIDQAENSFIQKHHDPKNTKWAKMALELGIQGYSMEQVQAAVDLVAREKSRYKKDGTVKCTQKVQGIEALHRFGRFGTQNVARICATLPYNESPMLNFPKEGLFARPCPTVPIHGGIDSGVVHTKQQVSDLAMKVWEKDRFGQLIVMPVLSGKWSAVVTDTSVSIGAGNDGATSMSSISIPIPTTFPKNLMKDAGIKEDEGNYLEVVESENDKPFSAMVQLRSGPKTVAGDVYVPEGFDIEGTLISCTLNEDKAPDLLTWGKTIETRNHNVYIMPGRSLSSHYAVHAILHGAVVLAGETAKEALVSWSDLHPDNYEAKHIAAIYKLISKHKAQKHIPHNMSTIKKSYSAWLKEKLPPHWLGYSAVNGVAILHSLPYLDGTQDELIGAALAWTVQAMTASCVGEARHWSMSTHNIDRSSVHTDVWQNTMKYIKLMEQWKDESFFNNAGWTSELTLNDVSGLEEWKAGIGGHKWQVATNLTMDLHNAVIDNNETEAFSIWNLCANVLHNGGRTVIGKTTQFSMEEIDTRQGAFVANSLTAYALGIIGMEVKKKHINESAMELFFDNEYNYMGRNKKGLLKPPELSYAGVPWKEGETIYTPAWSNHQDKEDIKEEYRYFRKKHPTGIFLAENDKKTFYMDFEDAWDDAANKGHVIMSLDMAWINALHTEAYKHSNWFEGIDPDYDDEDDYVWDDQEDDDIDS